MSEGPVSPHFRRALFVRLDRIGDLVLTLPTDQALQIDHVDWWIPRGLSFVTQCARPPRVSEEFSKEKTLSECFALARLVREKHYDLAIVFHAPWWVSFVLWLAKIPVRIGVKSQWHSFLFFNRGVRQKRSRAEHSELEYGFRLLENGLGLKAGSLPRSTLKLESKSGPQVLERTRLMTKEFYVVHPGMGGSALNWPTEKYAELIRALAQTKSVAITGTASDEIFLAPLKEKLARENPERIAWLDGKLNGDELIALLQNAAAVIAPSTGVLHLAASTGVPTIGLFSQVLVQRAHRWGPQGPRTAVVEAATDIDPELGMKQISVEQVLAALRAFR